MTIEATLQSIDGSLISIAASLEAIATGGAVPTPEKPAKATKATKATSSSKPKSTTKPADKPSSKTQTSADEDGPTITDVRKALGALQKVTSPDDARALLRKVGEAPTMSKLLEENYQAVIDAALEAASEAS